MFSSSRSPWQIYLGPKQQGPMSPGPSKFWLMLLLPTGPINPSLFPFCHTVLSAQRAQQLTPHSPAMQSVGIPKTPLLPPAVPLHFPTSIPFLLDFHHPGQHTACSGCGWWLVPSPLTFPFIPSNLGRRSLSFLLFLVLRRIPLSAHSG